MEDKASNVFFPLLYFSERPSEISARGQLEHLQVEFGDNRQHMVEDIGLYPLVWHPVFQGTEEIKLHRNAVVGRL